ncbi:MAG: hypothetical protein GQ574_28860 [Crocinitomix sp.]|nr:hypothetical protein [Crocinitomix sp.]
MPRGLFTKKENDGFDQIFIRAEGGDYTLDPLLEQYATAYGKKDVVSIYCRMHLVYRFGGVKNVIN